MVMVSPELGFDDYKVNHALDNACNFWMPFNSSAPPNQNSQYEHQSSKRDGDHLCSSMSRIINDQLVASLHFKEAFTIMHDQHILANQLLKSFKRATVWPKKRPAAPCPASYLRAVCCGDLNFVPGIGLGDDMANFGRAKLQTISRWKPCVEQ